MSAPHPGQETACYPSPEASYEEITQNPHFFFQTLHTFHKAFGTKFKVPTLGRKPLDLHRLFIEVTSRGGFEKILRDRRWKEVMVVFKYGPTFTNASFVLRKYYKSLLYHFEQVYFFRKKAPAIVAADNANKLSNGASMHDGFENQFSASPIGEAGVPVTGTIDRKYEKGFLVTVKMGSEELKGVLYYHPLSHGEYSMNQQLALKEACPPEKDDDDDDGYDVFFNEHYIGLKPLYHGQENVISKRIQVLWTTLTNEEKQVYQKRARKEEGK